MVRVKGSQFAYVSDLEVKSIYKCAWMRAHFFYYCVFFPFFLLCNLVSFGSLIRCAQNRDIDLPPDFFCKDEHFNLAFEFYLYLSLNVIPVFWDTFSHVLTIWVISIFFLTLSNCFTHLLNFLKFLDKFLLYHFFTRF